ncbi:MAG: hypothetical protein RIS47_1651 [Bacteroidota bacterium]|jgi:hypothetical protein
MNNKMNKLILFILFSISIISAFAQNDEEPTPYALKPQYKDLIRLGDLPANFVTPAFNNDSLYDAENMMVPPNSDNVRTGIIYPFTPKLNMQHNTSIITLDCGTVYIFKIVSPTSAELSLYMDTINISQEMQFSFIGAGPDEGYFEVFSDKRDFERRISSLGQELYVELFVPKNCKKQFVCSFKKYGYGYAGLKKKEY